MPPHVRQASSAVGSANEEGEDKVEASSELEETFDPSSAPHQLLRSVFTASPDAIIGQTLDDTITSWSPGATRLYGYTAAEAIGHPITLLVPEDRVEELEELHERVSSGEHVDRFETVHRTRAGDRLDMVLTASPVWDAEGQVTGVLFIGRDVTAWKGIVERLSRRERQQAAVAQLGMRALEGGPLQPLMEAATQQVRETLGVEYCTILEVTSKGTDLVFRAGVGCTPGVVGQTKASVGAASQAGYTLLSDEPVIVADLRVETRFDEPTLRACGILGGLSVVIQGREQPYGVLEAHTLRDVSFTVDDVNFMQAVANLLGEAVARKQAEAAFQASEQRYKQLVEYANDIIYRADLKGRFTYANPVAVRLFGYPKEALIGTVYLALVREDFRKEIRRFYLGQLEAGTPGTYYEFPAITKAGEEIWLGQNVQLVWEGDQVVGVQAVARDITKRKQAETLINAKKRVLELIAEGAPLPHVLDVLVETIEEQIGDDTYASISLLDEGGLHLRHGAAPSLPERYNQAIDGLPIGPRAGSCGTAAYRKKTVIVTDIAQDPLWADYREIGLQYGLRACWSTPILSNDGAVLGTFALYYLEPRAPDLRHQQLVSFLNRTAAIAIERKRAERQLRELNETLEQRVALRTGELEALNEQLTAEVEERRRTEEALERTNLTLQQRNRELQDFAHVASHDLQEPLRKIGAFADLMRADYGAVVDETGQYYLDRMQDAARRMSQLITDLLAFSRISTSGWHFEAIDLKVVVVEVLSDLEYTLDEVGGRVVVEALPEIEADPMQMRQLFQNLIGNALKFHRSGVPPIVRVYGWVEQVKRGVSKVDEPICHIAIQDNGIGFDETYLDRIFSPFQRLNSQKEYAGSGIGLAVCRRIVERHQGDLSATSVLGEGSTFTVTLPVRHLE